MAIDSGIYMEKYGINVYICSDGLLSDLILILLSGKRLEFAMENHHPQEP